MKIECPVCHQQIPITEIRDVREFDCPHCHFRIEMESFAASLLQLIPIAVLILFIVIYTVLSIFISDTLLVIIFLVLFLGGSRLHWDCYLLRYLGLLQFHRKVEKNKKI